MSFYYWTININACVEKSNKYQYWAFMVKLKYQYLLISHVKRSSYHGVDKM